MITYYNQNASFEYTLFKFDVMNRKFCKFKQFGKYSYIRLGNLNLKIMFKYNIR